ncbi:MAG: cation transporter [Euryarchaeota archaeon]|nr:cation transporter [Euryarchaeota archaeon]
MERKVKAARVSIVSNTTLVLLKFTVGIFMASVSVISEAVHSMMDLLAALIANYSVRKAVEPADEKHPYGHGKFENVSGVIEAMLIVIAAIIIIYEATNRLIKGGVVEYLGYGIAVMGFSAVVNFFVSRYLYKVAIEEESLALEADALHLRTDVWTSVGITLGLVIIHFTGINALDPIIAMGVAILIIRAAWDMTKRSGTDLLDACLSPEEERIIRKALESHSDQFLGYHSMRTRKAGSEKYVDLHLVIRYDTTIEEGHRIATEVEQEIEAALPRTDVTIHMEPCDKDECFTINGTRVCLLDHDDSEPDCCPERGR